MHLTFDRSVLNVRRSDRHRAAGACSTFLILAFSTLALSILAFLVLSSPASCQTEGFTEVARKSDFAAFVQQFEGNYAYADRAAKPWLTWLARYGEAAAAAQSKDAYDAVLAAALSELHDFHAEVRSHVADRWLPVPTFADVWAEFHGEDADVVAVRHGSDAERAGIRAGDRILRVGDLSVRQAVDDRLGPVADRDEIAARDWALLLVLAGRSEEARRFTTLDRGGLQQTVVLAVQRRSDRPEGALTAHMLPGGIGVIRLNNSLGEQKTVAAFDQALEQLRQSRGLVLDLRDVPSGGDSSVALGILGRFVARMEPYQRHRIPRYGQADGERNWMELVAPRGPFRYGAPVVILVDHWTGSMGEGMAIGLDAMHRALVLGTPMAHLAGAVSDFVLPRTRVDVAYATEQLFHVNGTPRQEWLPPLIVPAEATGPEDALLERGVREVERALLTHHAGPRRRHDQD